MSDNNSFIPMEIGKNQKIQEIVEKGDSLLTDVSNSLDSVKKTMSMPIAQLATLGTGVSSLVPAIRSATQTVETNTAGLYKLANARVGDTLKKARNGTSGVP